MLRHGMLSPNSKLLPLPEGDSTRLSIMSNFTSSSYLSNTSNLSLMSTTSTSSKHPKDARDTPRRRVRHRDGKLLQGGIGLTTGLGWSDRLVSSFFLSWLVALSDSRHVLFSRRDPPLRMEWQVGMNGVRGKGWILRRRLVALCFYVRVDRIPAGCGCRDECSQAISVAGWNRTIDDPVPFHLVC
jgi:hypothetical protein